MATVRTDLRDAVRAFRRQPMLSAMAVLVLGVGVGAATAMAALVETVLLRPLRYPAPDRLIAIEESADLSQAPVPVNAVHFLEWRRAWPAADDLALVGEIAMTLTAAGEPERLTVGRVSPSLFHLLGLSPQIGRPFEEADDRAGRDHVVLLSAGFWRRRFGADPLVAGRTLTLDGQPFEVIGVLPDEAALPRLGQLVSMPVRDTVPDLWKPFGLADGERAPMGDFNYGAIARLRPGVSMAQAHDELQAVQARLARDIGATARLGAVLTPLHEAMTRRSRNGLLLMLCAVAAVLLVGYVNVVNLLLARALTQQREFAIRAALGASAFQLRRQALAEALVLAVAAGTLGIGVAYGVLRIVVASAPIDLPRLDEIHVDGRVFGIAIALTALTALACGSLPGWRRAKTPALSVRGDAGRGATETRSGRRVRSLLVGAEVAASTVCLIAAALLLASLVRLLSVDKGFDTTQVSALELSLPAYRYPDTPRRAVFLQQLIEQVRVIPAVAAVGVSNKLPLTGEGSNNILTLEQTTTPAWERPVGDFRCVSPGFFSALRIPLIKGRIFDDGDRRRGVAVVSAQTAARLWPGQDPIGKRFRVGGEGRPLEEVVGVVGDTRNSSLDRDPGLTVYIPYWERDRDQMTMVIRTTAGGEAVPDLVRGVVHRADALLPVPALRSMTDRMRASVASRTFQLVVVAIFAVLATVLASLGVYGVVSASVAGRRREVGVRLALGSTPGGVRALIVRQSMTPVLLGLLAGCIASVASGRLLRGFLYGVTSSDPVVIAGVAIGLAAVAAAACYLPARRVTQADPLAALRSE